MSFSSPYHLGTGWVVRHWTETYVVRVGMPEAVSQEQMRQTAQALFVLSSEHKSGDPYIAPILEAIHRALFSPGVLAPRPAGIDARDRIRRDLEFAANAGRLTILPKARAAVRARRTERPILAAPPAPAAPVLQAIEIVLCDESGAPVAGQRFAILLSDGTRRSERLDANGRARFDGIPAGLCELSFVDLDASAWEVVRSEAL